MTTMIFFFFLVELMEFPWKTNSMHVAVVRKSLLSKNTIVACQSHFILLLVEMSDFCSLAVVGNGFSTEEL